LGHACSKTLFASLKVERLHSQRFGKRRQAKDEVIVLGTLVQPRPATLHAGVCLPDAV